MQLLTELRSKIVALPQKIQPSPDEEFAHAQESVLDALKPHLFLYRNGTQGYFPVIDGDIDIGYNRILFKTSMKPDGQGGYRFRHKRTIYYNGDVSCTSVLGFSTDSSASKVTPESLSYKIWRREEQEGKTMLRPVFDFDAEVNGPSILDEMATDLAMAQDIA